MRYQKECTEALKFLICITFTPLNIVYSNVHAGIESPSINQIASTTHQTAQKPEYPEIETKKGIQKILDIVEQKDDITQQLAISN